MRTEKFPVLALQFKFSPIFLSSCLLSDRSPDFVFITWQFWLCIYCQGILNLAQSEGDNANKRGATLQDYDGAAFKLLTKLGSRRDPAGWCGDALHQGNSVPQVQDGVQLMDSTFPCLFSLAAALHGSSIQDETAPSWKPITCAWKHKSLRCGVPGDTMQ